MMQKNIFNSTLELYSHEIAFMLTRNSDIHVQSITGGSEISDLTPSTNYLPPPPSEWWTKQGFSHPNCSLSPPPQFLASLLSPVYTIKVGQSVWHELW